MVVVVVVVVAVVVVAVVVAAVAVVVVVVVALVVAVVMVVVGRGLPRRSSRPGGPKQHPNAAEGFSDAALTANAAQATLARCIGQRWLTLNASDAPPRRARDALRRRTRCANTEARATRAR